MYVFADSFAGYDPANYAHGCISEFGPHDEHSECLMTMEYMADPGGEYVDYSDWYGGERGYQDGLRWSDFV